MHSKLYLPDADHLESLRALCRYETHGGYIWAGVMSDGDLMCVSCLRANYRQVFRATRKDADRSCVGPYSEWEYIGYTNSGESEKTEYCCNCNKPIWIFRS